MTNEYIKAFRESAADTILAVIINTPLNFILISLAFHWNLSPLWTTIFLTSVFTIVALFRKTHVRLIFARRYHKNNITQSNSSK